MQVQETNEIRALTAEEVGTVAGGNILAEAGKALLGWAIGKIAESSNPQHPYETLKQWKAWQDSLGK